MSSRKSGPATFGKADVSSANRKQVNYSIEKSMSGSESVDAPQSKGKRKNRSSSMSSESGSEKSSDMSSSASSNSNSSRRRRRNKDKKKEAKEKSKEKSKDKSKEKSDMSNVNSKAKRSTGNLSPNSSSSAVAQAGGEVASNEKVILVKQLQPFSQTVNWSTTDYLIHVNKSMRELEAMSDANGNVAIGLGDGSVTIERTTPGIHTRLNELRSKASATSLASSPGEHSISDHVVHSATIVSAHNGFPIGVRMQLKNIVASAKHHVFPVNSNGELQNLTFSVQQGEKLNNHEVFNNQFESKEGFKFFNAFNGFTPNNLRDGVVSAMPLNGVQRLAVPHSDTKLHPVVMLAQTNIGEVITPEQKAKYGDVIPPELMSASADAPGYYLMSNELFENFHARCQKGLREKNPLSDVSNPHGQMWVSTRDIKAAAAGGSNSSSSASVSSQTSMGFSKARLDNDFVASNAKSLWTASSEIDTNRVGSAAKESARDTRYNFFCRLRVLSQNVSHLASQI